MAPRVGRAATTQLVPAIQAEQQTRTIILVSTEVADATLLPNEIAQRNIDDGTPKCEVDGAVLVSDGAVYAILVGSCDGDRLGEGSEEPLENGTREAAQHRTTVEVECLSPAVKYEHAFTFAGYCDAAGVDPVAVKRLGQTLRLLIFAWTCRV